MTWLRSALSAGLVLAGSAPSEAEQGRRSLLLHEPNGTFRDRTLSAATDNSLPDAIRQLILQPRPCFVFVHDIAEASIDRYDQRDYFVALTTLLDDLLKKWRFDKIDGCKSVLFTMLTSDKTGYGELAEIDLEDLQSVDNRNFDASDANLARTTDVVSLCDLYRRIRFIGREPGSPIYAALHEFLNEVYSDVVNSTEPMFEETKRERSRQRQQ